jgi:hypothetical protein
MGILIIILLILLFPLIAYFSDKSKDRSGNDNFKRGGLFARYGKEIYSSVIPIQIDPKKTSKSSEEVIAGIKRFLMAELEKQFANTPRFSLAELSVKDLKKSKDVRDFLRFSFVTPRNTKIHSIVYIPILGDQIIVQQMVHMRGNYYWYDVLWFLITSPLTFLFWIRRWFRGEYNIVANLSTKFNTSSFDYLDSLTIFKTTTVLTQTLVMQYARENGLLTEEIEKMIVQNITNSQNINISKSSGVKLGAISAAFKK